MSYVLSMFIEATAKVSTSVDVTTAEMATKQDFVDMIAQLRAELGIHL